MMKIKPVFIAHRGYPALYPENSLAGIDAAIRAGARHVEIDIQLGSSLTPFLCHDDHLQRLTGQDIYLTLSSDTEIENLAVPYPTSLPYSASRSEPISRLADFCQYLACHPPVSAFVEIKAESIARFGLQQTVSAIVDEISPVRSQCIMISFVPEALVMIRNMGMFRIGWVIERRDATTQAMASRLSPDFLFCDTGQLAETIEDMWKGSWQWIIYSVNDPAEVTRYLNAGFALIETDDIGTMLNAALT